MVSICLLVANFGRVRHDKWRGALRPKWDNHSPHTNADRADDS